MNNETITHSESFSAFSVYILPGSFALLNFVVCLSALLATSFDDGMFHSSWNILYYFMHGFKNQYIYIIRLEYSYRKTTVDFNKTSVVLQFVEVNDIHRSTIRIPAQFFGQNKHNSFHSNYAIIKFLLIRDYEFHSVNKVAITHDSPGELNVSVVGIQNSTSNEGFVSCVEKCIKSLSIEEMEQQQCFIATPQSNMELEGSFALNEGISSADFVGPAYWVFNMICYRCATDLINSFVDKSSPKPFLFFYSINLANVCGLTYFYLVFGLFGLIHVMTKYQFDGKPFFRYNKILYLYNVLCIFIGIVFAIKTVAILDPEHLLDLLQSTNYLHLYLYHWMIAVMYAIGIIFLYGLPFSIIYSVLISLIFQKYKSK